MHFEDIRHFMSLVYDFFIINIMPIICIIIYTHFVSSMYTYFNIFPLYFNKTYINHNNDNVNVNDNVNNNDMIIGDDNYIIDNDDTDKIPELVLIIMPILMIGIITGILSCIYDLVDDDDR